MVSERGIPRYFALHVLIPLAQRLLAGDRRALARGISLVEDNRAGGWQLVREVYPHTGSAAVVGFTGPPGVGKSTLIGALTRLRRAAGRTVGVLSIDPSSPFTHGALLGDRIRLGEHFLDPGVFIRSMANRGALGASPRPRCRPRCCSTPPDARTCSWRPSGWGRRRSTSSTTPTPWCWC